MFGFLAVFLVYDINLNFQNISKLHLGVCLCHISAENCVIYIEILNEHFYKKRHYKNNVIKGSGHKKKMGSFNFEC
jgi:hypothetical protein